MLADDVGPGRTDGMLFKSRIGIHPRKVVASREKPPVPDLLLHTGHVAEARRIMGFVNRDIAIRHCLKSQRTSLPATCGTTAPLKGEPVLHLNACEFMSQIRTQEVQVLFNALGSREHVAGLQTT